MGSLDKFSESRAGEHFICGCTCRWEALYDFFWKTFHFPVNFIDMILQLFTIHESWKEFHSGYIFAKTMQCIDFTFDFVVPHIFTVFSPAGRKFFDTAKPWQNRCFTKRRKEFRKRAMKRHGSQFFSSFFGGISRTLTHEICDPLKQKCIHRSVVEQQRKSVFRIIFRRFRAVITKESHKIAHQKSITKLVFGRSQFLLVVEALIQWWQL